LFAAVEGGCHSVSPATVDSEGMSEDEEEDEEEEEEEDDESEEVASVACGPLRAVFSNVFTCFDFDEHADAGLVGHSSSGDGAESNQVSSRRTPPMPFWGPFAAAVASADPLLEATFDLADAKPAPLDLVASAPQKATYEGFVLEAVRLSPTPSGPSLGSAASGLAACLGGGDVSGGDSDSEGSWQGDGSTLGPITAEPGRPPVATAVTQSASLVANLCAPGSSAGAPSQTSRAPSPDAVDAGTWKTSYRRPGPTCAYAPSRFRATTGPSKRRTRAPRRICSPPWKVPEWRGGSVCQRTGSCSRINSR
jgi:hypothetical protein